MRLSGTWLERFRRPAGVPAAATDELETELIPVFAALEDVEAEAAGVRTEAEQDADRRVTAASAEAARRLADWRRRAEAERVRARDERRRALEAEAEAVETESRAEAERLLRDGRERISGLVAVVLAMVKEPR
jgi:vacuolar-type H+-ATPase subunit H